MSLSDSDLNFSEFSDFDEDSYFADNLHENLMFNLICQEPSLFKSTKKFCGVKEIKSPIIFIYLCTDIMFYRQFRTDREDFTDLLNLMILGYPGHFITNKVFINTESNGCLHKLNTTKMVSNK